jgi:hypothetical protein
MSAARNIAIRYCDKNGLESTFDDVLIPAVDLAGMERSENHISQENQRNDQRHYCRAGEVVGRQVQQTANGFEATDTWGMRAG